MISPEEIIKTYEATSSMKATAKICGIREQVVRRVLITAGTYASPLSEKIADLREEGYTIAEIAEILKLTKGWVITNTPYTKGSYVIGEKTENALKIQKSRNNKKEK